MPQNPVQQTIYDGSAGSRCPVSAATRRARIGLYRHRDLGTSDMLTSAPAQDAHLVVLQIQGHPAHDFWADGRHRRLAGSGQGGMAILDLRAQSSALFRDPVDSLHLHLPRAALEDLAEELRAPPIDALAIGTDWKADDGMMQQLQPLLAETLEAPETVQPLIDHLVLAAATHLVTAYGGARPDALRRGGLAPWQVRCAKELLAARLATGVPLIEVAEACGLSLAHFARAFRISTGVTPHGWLQQCRIGRARELLVRPDLSLAEIALRCGFADQSHFTRMFRRATGLGPGAWRRLRAM